MFVWWGGGMHVHVRMCVVSLTGARIILAEGGKSFSSLSYSGGAFWGCSRQDGPQRGQLHSRLLVSASCIAIGPSCPVAR